MLYKITNKGGARTVDYLGVFAEGEAKEFTEEDLANFQHMSGVPVFSSVLADKGQFDMQVITTDQKEG